MALRLISRLDVKMAHLIKGVQMEGWRKMGDPKDRAKRYYADGADEILYIDVVASLYERNNLHDIVRDVASETFVPITVGGGISDLVSAKALMDVGADKLAINTAATKRPELLRELSDTFGSQAVVLNIEAKSLPGGGWTVMTDNGRNHTGLDAISWAADAPGRGVGEILITSIDCDGTGRGMDLDLISAVTKEVDIPVIASGGCATAVHALDATRNGASAVALARALHSDNLTLGELRRELQAAGLNIRPLPSRQLANV
ncbi:MAG: imidazole glycerol phosphate synthase subunit HisF [Paracoccaceae bacterium]